MRVTALIALLVLVPESDISAKVRPGLAKKLEWLESIRFPPVRYEEGSLEDVLAHIYSRAIELDNQNHVIDKGIWMTVKGLDFVYNLRGDLPKRYDKLRITYTHKGQKMSELLTDIAELAKLNLYVTSKGLIFCEPGTPPFSEEEKLKHKVWHTLIEFPPKE